MPTFSTAEFSIGYDQIPNPASENVLFLHGNLASKEWWHPTIEALKQTPKSGEGTFLAVDWRGYGESKGIQSAGQIDFDVFAEDQVRLLEEKGLKNVHVVGHSTGGLIAMLSVLKKPELFKSLTLLDSIGLNGLDLEIPKPQVLEHFEKMSIDKDYCRGVLAATIKDCDPQSSAFERLFEITWKCDSPMWQGVIDVLSGPLDYTEEAHRLSLPTLILHGSDDAVIPLKVAQKNQSLLPDAKLKVLEGQGHSPNMEVPEIVAHELRQFWA